MKKIIGKDINGEIIREGDFMTHKTKGFVIWTRNQQEKHMFYGCLKTNAILTELKETEMKKRAFDPNKDLYWRDKDTEEVVYVEQDGKWVLAPHKETDEEFVKKLYPEARLELVHYLPPARDNFYQYQINLEPEARKQNHTSRGRHPIKEWTKARNKIDREIRKKFEN